MATRPSHKAGAYPILGTPNGAFPFDAVFLGPTVGVLVFDVVEGKEVGEFKDRQDDFFTKLQSKLIQYPALVRRRDLIVPIHTATFAPAVKTDDYDEDEDHPVLTTQHVEDFITGMDWNEANAYPVLASALQSLSNIRKGRKRREAVSAARAMLFSKKINNSLAGVSTSPDVFFEQDVVTFTGIFRAKGNEAAMVYIINADDFTDGHLRTSSLAHEINFLPP